jgi:hypothetical protein
VASQEFGGVGTAPIPVNEGDMLGFSGLAGAAYGAVIRW